MKTMNVIRILLRFGAALFLGFAVGELMKGKIETSVACCLSAIACMQFTDVFNDPA